MLRQYAALERSEPFAKLPTESLSWTECDPMFIQQSLRRLNSGFRRIGTFLMDIVYLLFALCVEIADRFEPKE